MVEINPWPRNMLEGNLTKLDHGYRWSKKHQDDDGGDVGGIKGKNISITIKMWWLNGPY